ncbi:copper homeostasis protein CutC [Nocardia tenerifensis]|uniref:PF03932 family protein CutC n=2 Tax=Nocardia tenerifensis TaxID=228006 RepID=A0A318K9C3_9NOCA|nr:copper homeostasis protein CutC [Nocardia tenerifensis]
MGVGRRAAWLPGRAVVPGILTAMRIEISVESSDGVRVAEEAGADRVELCSGLTDGGLTPSAGLMEVAVARTVRTQVHVLIRPRPGDFRYSADELAVMMRDIRVAREAGADGIVVGALDASGNLDPVCAAFLEEAEGLETTLHRAIDVCASSQRALDQAIEFGFTRVLTSGREHSVLDGAGLIKELVRQADGAIQVMACGGVRASLAPRIIQATEVDDLHAAVRTAVPGAAQSAALFAGVGVPEGYDRWDADPGEVKVLCDIARSHNSRARK